MTRKLLDVAGLGVAVAVGLLLAPTIVAIGGNILFSVAPVMHDWRVTSASADGKDLIIQGTVRKRWACEYIPPPRAIDDSGVILRVTSNSALPYVSWPADNEVRVFGPWRIEGGAGRKVMIHQQHGCWRVLDSYSNLGVFDAREIK